MVTNEVGELADEVTDSGLLDRAWSGPALR